LHKLFIVYGMSGETKAMMRTGGVRVLSTVRASVHLCWHVIICTRRIHVPSTAVAVDTFKLGRETFNKTLRDTPDRNNVYLTYQRKIALYGGAILWVILSR